MNKEIYKPIKGYEGYYEISNLGNVKSLQRTIEREGGSTMVLTERVLKPNLTTAGYYHIGLRKGGKRKAYTIHRLIATTFIDNPEGLPQVNHIDEDKTNNRIDNLEWCTAKYNMNYSLAKTVYQYTLSGELVKEWDSATTACKDGKYTAPNITNVCNGTYSHHKGYKWSHIPLD